MPPGTYTTQGAGGRLLEWGGVLGNVSLNMKAEGDAFGLDTFDEQDEPRDFKFFALAIRKAISGVASQTRPTLLFSRELFAVAHSGTRFEKAWLSFFSST
jgi:hypothetical protein